MCRYLAYLGKKPMVLSQVVLEPDNSLLKQSMQAQEATTVVNGDGFGLGWYVPEIRGEPALYRSILPAWNDRNLRSLARSTKASCFIAHVRSATIASVDFNNCHPFKRDDILFAHNGAVNNFLEIKKDVAVELSRESWKEIGGQTDTEYFFGLFYDCLEERSARGFLKAFQRAKDKLLAIQKDILLRLNIVVTDGKELMATRYSHGEHEPLSLYYSEAIDDGVLVASEKLSTPTESWEPIPRHTAILVDAKHQASLEPI